MINLNMSLATAELPIDPEALRAFALACQAELKAAELSVQLRTLEIEKLKFQIAKLRRMQCGLRNSRPERLTISPGPRRKIGRSRYVST